MDGLIIEHTRLVAAELERRFARDPEGELEAWTGIAQQREAMVVAIYGGANLNARLPDQAGAQDLIAVIRKAVGGIWAQETSHQALIGALRSVDEVRAPQLQGFMGAVEGGMTDWATRRGPLGPIARFFIGFGRAANLAPPFTRELAALNLRQFFRFSHELELTAGQGYSRILDLLNELELRPAGPPINYGLTPRYEFAKTRAEETFHAAVFEHLQSWLSPDGTQFLPRAGRAAVLELREIADRILRLPSVTEWPLSIRGEPAQEGLESSVAWISDGGLGDLFQAFELAVPVAPPPSEPGRVN